MITVIVPPVVPCDESELPVEPQRCVRKPGFSWHVTTDLDKGCECGWLNRVRGLPVPVR